MFDWSSLQDQQYVGRFSWWTYSKLKIFLQKNSILHILLTRYIKSYLHKTYDESSDSAKDNTNTRYFKLPFIGRYSEQAQQRINNIIKKCCKSVTVKLIFDSYKIGQMFSAKDCLPSNLKSNVIYKFQCASYNACYIGETTRHLTSRIEEYLKKDKQSHIYKHIHEKVDCFDKSDSDCFSILDVLIKISPLISIFLPHSYIFSESWINYLYDDINKNI